MKAKKKTTKAKNSEPTSGVCVRDGCPTICKDDNYCHGCKAFICEPHTTVPGVVGFGHQPEDHWGGAHAAEGDY